MPVVHTITRKEFLYRMVLKKCRPRLNIDNKVSKVVDLGFALSLNRTNIDQVSADNAFSTPMQLVALSPITPVRDEEGIPVSDTNNYIL